MTFRRRVIFAMIRSAMICTSLFITDNEFNISPFRHPRQSLVPPFVAEQETSLGRALGLCILPMAWRGLMKEHRCSRFVNPTLFPSNPSYSGFIIVFHFSSIASSSTPSNPTVLPNFSPIRIIYVCAFQPPCRHSVIAKTST